MNFVLSDFHIPSSKQDQLQSQYGRGQVNTARANYIIDDHPAPSWTIVANALWFWKAAGALEMVQRLYLKGEPCAHSCRSEGRIGSGLKLHLTSLQCMDCMNFCIMSIGIAMKCQIRSGIQQKSTVCDTRGPCSCYLVLQFFFMLSCILCVHMP